MGLINTPLSAVSVARAYCLTVSGSGEYRRSSWTSATALGETKPETNDTFLLCFVIDSVSIEIGVNSNGELDEI